MWHGVDSDFINTGHCHFVSMAGSTLYCSENKQQGVQWCVHLANFIYEITIIQLLEIRCLSICRRDPSSQRWTPMTIKILKFLLIVLNQTLPDLGSESNTQ